jgi:methyltransferase (TIGR00027 family)
VFEVDAEITQKAKLGRYREVGISIPDNTSFIAIDFNKDDPMEFLIKNGFQRGKGCLFILEGLLMYLDDDAVDMTFDMIHDLSGEGSRVVFDYIYSSVLSHEERYFGERELLKNVTNSGEPWTFGFKEGKVGEYLIDHGFNIEEECNTEILEKRYFTSYNGELIGRINGTHSIVLAKPI